jgi:hypothetical protein
LELEVVIVPYGSSVVVSIFASMQPANNRPVAIAGMAARVTRRTGFVILYSIAFSTPGLRLHSLPALLIGQHAPMSVLSVLTIRDCPLQS